MSKHDLIDMIITGKSKKQYITEKMMIWQNRKLVKYLKIVILLSYH